MLTALLSLLLVAAPQKLEIQKIDAQKPDAPKIDLNLPQVPKADGVKAGEAPKNDQMQTKTAAGDLRSVSTTDGPSAKVVSVVHAKDFAATKNGYKPVSGISGFNFTSLPARVGAFKTCVRLSSTNGIPVQLKVSFKSPAGNELLSSRADVNFGAGSEMDVVIEWDGFEANAAGDYKVLVTLDGKPSGEFPIHVQGR
ncbi:MAG: hypothetical protein QM765_00260 [Myxococcales bacterium]